MSAPVLTIVNRVLRKLRESSINSISGDEQAELITDFLTETKEVVEDAYDWRALQGTVLLDTVADTYRYKLQGTYHRSLIKELYDQTNDTYLEFNPRVVKENLKLATLATGNPKYWDYVGFNDDEMVIDVWPVPAIDDIRIFVNGKYVQGDVGYTDPATTYIYTPTLPLVLGTYARAIDERGDDDGEAFNKADAKFKDALANSIQMENAMQRDTQDWEVE